MSKFFSEKNAEFINANDRNFQVLRNLILQKRAKFALIYSLKVSQIYKPYGLFYASPFQLRWNLFIAVWCSKGWHKRSDWNYHKVKNEKDFIKIRQIKSTPKFQKSAIRQIKSPSNLKQKEYYVKNHTFLVYFTVYFIHFSVSNSQFAKLNPRQILQNWSIAKLNPRQKSHFGQSPN